MIRRPPRSTPLYSSAASDVYKRQTQHSVAALRSIGIQPDAIVCRADRDIPASVKNKIALMCDVEPQAVVTAKDAPSIYDIPRVLHSEGLDAYVVRRLDLPFHDVQWGRGTTSCVASTTRRKRSRSRWLAS